MVKFIGMVGQPRRNSAKMVSWSRVSEHLVNLIGMSDQLKWNNQQTPFLNNTKVLVFFILIPLPISLKEAYHEHHYDIFAA